MALWIVKLSVFLLPDAFLAFLLIPPHFFQLCVYKERELQFSCRQLGRKNLKESFVRTKSSQVKDSFRIEKGIAA
jgi:hypothetical protein